MKNKFAVVGGSVRVTALPTIKAYAGIYAELTRPNEQDAKPIVFPDKCPNCSAPAIGGKDGNTFWASVRYECGGGYDPKPQIQNHTHKWWGHCGRN